MTGAVVADVFGDFGFLASVLQADHLAARFEAYEVFKGVSPIMGRNVLFEPKGGIWAFEYVANGPHTRTGTVCT